MSWRNEIIFLIKEERIAQGLSQEELGYRAGLHRTYIGSVERGEKNITIDTLERIADALGINKDELFKIKTD